MSLDLYAQNGTTADYVSTAQNAAGSNEPNTVLEVSPDRGTWLRILNHVNAGSQQGIPVYMDLQNSAGNNLPPNTRMFFSIALSNSGDDVRVSQKVKNIAFWNQNSLTTQRNKNDVDGAKVVLEHPSMAPSSGPAEKVDVRDIDTFKVKLQSADQIDWTNSSFFFDSSAIEGPYDR